MYTYSLLLVRPISFVIYFIQDTTNGAQNETLIIDNFGITHSSLGITDHTYASYTTEGGRTWIADSTLTQMDTIRIVRDAHIAVHPDLDS